MHETASMPDQSPTDVDSLDQLTGFQPVEQLRQTDKAVTIAGGWHGRDVVAKQLASSERHWIKRFAHEVGVYRAFAATPPPWRVPRLHHADRRVLIIERLPGAARTPTDTHPGYPSTR